MWQYFVNRMMTSAANQITRNWSCDLVLPMWDVFLEGMVATKSSIIGIMKLGTRKNLKNAFWNILRTFFGNNKKKNLGQGRFRGSGGDDHQLFFLGGLICVLIHCHDCNANKRPIQCQRVRSCSSLITDLKLILLTQRSSFITATFLLRRCFPNGQSFQGLYFHSVLLFFPEIWRGWCKTNEVYW
jgi:hypothetical protein